MIQLDFDAEKLESILSNLISNAFKYTSEEGKLFFLLIIRKMLSCSRLKTMASEFLKNIMMLFSIVSFR